MKTRVHLRTPYDMEVVRDIHDGAWAEPSGDPDVTLGAGLFALPGLVDGHAHFGAPIGADWKSDTLENAKHRVNQALSAGVLLALDKGWSDLHTVEIIDTVAPDLRPEIEAAGIINAVKEGYWPKFARELDESNFEEGVQKSLTDARGWIKFVGDWPRRGRGPVANFTEEQLRSAVHAAEAVGSRVAIHTMAREAPSMAVNAGVHSIEHGLFLDESDLERLGSRSGMWVPTILRMEAVVDQIGAESTGGKLLLEGLENVRRLLPLAAEAGVWLLAGTDVTVGAHDVAQEAQRLVDYGLAIDKALDAVSINGYAAVDRPQGFEVGSSADAVLFGANPRDEFGVLTHPEVIIRRGRLVA